MALALSEDRLGKMACEAGPRWQFAREVPSGEFFERIGGCDIRRLKLDKGAKACGLGKPQQGGRCPDSLSGGCALEKSVNARGSESRVWTECTNNCKAQHESCEEVIRHDLDPPVCLGFGRSVQSQPLKGKEMACPDR